MGTTTETMTMSMSTTRADEADMIADREYRRRVALATRSLTAATRLAEGSAERGEALRRHFATFAAPVRLHSCPVRPAAAV